MRERKLFEIEKSSCRTKRSVEPARPIHVLSILCLLLLPHAVDIVPGNLGVLGTPKSREPHSLQHRCFDIVNAFVSPFHLHVRIMFISTTRCFWGIRYAIRLTFAVSRPYISPIISSVRFRTSRRRCPRTSPGSIVHRGA